jgi:hypothetical protein
MGLLVKPHAVQVFAPDFPIDSLGAVLTEGQVGSQIVRGQLTPSTSAMAFERWGLQLSRPYEFLCDPGDAALFIPNGWVVWDNARFRVRATPMVFRAIAAADHALVLLEQVS